MWHNGSTWHIPINPVFGFYCKINTHVFKLFFRINLIHDIFGRERHKLHHENMGGVGSFEKECWTLYVGRLGKHYDLENVLWSEFGEWGEIEVGVP